MKPLADLNETSFAIQNAKIVDPETKKVFPGTVVVKDGVIEGVEEGTADVAVPVYDGEGLHLSPGFVDIHVHFREPGYEYKETIATGSQAAAAGGFTTVACMPNTDPAIDERNVVEFIIKQAKIAGFAKVHPIAAATVGRKGEKLTEYAELVDAGAVAVSDDGEPVSTAGMVRRVLEYAAYADVPLIEHCEDMSASGDGVMHEGTWSTKLGLKGIPAHSEEVCLARDLLVLESVPNARFHGAHMSTKGSMELIRTAKAKGLPVTAETAPHYLCLTDADLAEYDTCKRINPPLRSAADRDAIIEAVKDGTIDCIASDHAPHAEHEKEVEFDVAPPGSLGLETTLGILLTHMVKPGHITLAEALALITHKAADCLSLDAGRLRKGFAADLTLFDPEAIWTVTEGEFQSKSQNCAFTGMNLQGKVRHTILDGVNVTSRLVAV